jgi:hypothetical protein
LKSKLYGQGVDIVVWLLDRLAVAKVRLTQPYERRNWLSVGVILLWFHFVPVLYCPCLDSVELLLLLCLSCTDALVLLSRIYAGGKEADGGEVQDWQEQVVLH